MPGLLAFESAPASACVSAACCNHCLLGPLIRHTQPIREADDRAVLDAAYAAVEGGLDKEVAAQAGADGIAPALLKPTNRWEGRLIASSLGPWVGERRARTPPLEDAGARWRPPVERGDRSRRCSEWRVLDRKTSQKSRTNANSRYLANIHQISISA